MIQILTENKPYIPYWMLNEITNKAIKWIQNIIYLYRLPETRLLILLLLAQVHCLHYLWQLLMLRSLYWCCLMNLLASCWRVLCDHEKRLEFLLLLALHNCHRSIYSVFFFSIYRCISAYATTHPEEMKEMNMKEKGRNKIELWIRSEINFDIYILL